MRPGGAHRGHWLLPLALLVALVLLGGNEMAHRRSQAAMAALEKRVEARRDVQLMLRLVVDAESSQRGYLLTGRDEYLDPYAVSVDTVRVLSQRVLDAYAGQVDTQALVAEIVDGVDAKLSEMAVALEFHREGRPDAWRELLLTNIGLEKMDAVRAAAEDLYRLETERIDASRDRVADTLWINRIGLNALVGLSLLALVLYRRQALRFNAAQRRHADELQAERDQLESEVERRTAELAELAGHLQTAREDERSHLARELHDELGALLTAAKLDAARLRRTLADAPPEAHTRLQHLVDSLKRVIELKRRIIEDLRPSSLSNLGLRAALDILAREFAERSEIRVDTALDEVQVDDSTAIAVYRMVQEALTNVTRHARAQTVTIGLRAEADGVAVEVHDDGRGFDAEAARHSRHGLVGMRHRIESLGGRLRIESAPGQGTRLRARLPVQPEAPGPA
jgi:signal transduction histidine kinase